MPEQVIQAVADLIATANAISVRNVAIAKALRAIEIVLTEGVNNEAIAQTACMSGLEILQTMHYQQALISEDEGK